MYLCLCWRVFEEKAGTVGSKQKRLEVITGGKQAWGSHCEPANPLNQATASYKAGEHDPMCARVCFARSQAREGFSARGSSSSVVCGSLLMVSVVRARFSNTVEPEAADARDQKVLAWPSTASEYGLVAASLTSPAVYLARPLRIGHVCLRAHLVPNRSSVASFACRACM